MTDLTPIFLHILASYVRSSHLQHGSESPGFLDSNKKKEKLLIIWVGIYAYENKYMLDFRERYLFLR